MKFNIGFANLKEAQGETLAGIIDAALKLIDLEVDHGAEYAYSEHEHSLEFEFSVRNMTEEQADRLVDLLTFIARNVYDTDFGGGYNVEAAP